MESACPSYIRTSAYALRRLLTFMSIKAADPGRFLDCLDTDVASMIAALGCIPAHSLAFGYSQGREQAKSAAFEAQATKMVEHRLPGWKVAGQIAPWAESRAGYQPVEKCRLKLINREGCIVVHPS